MSQVPHEWVVSHMNKSCHVWMSTQADCHVTHSWLLWMSPHRWSCHISMSLATHGSAHTEDHVTKWMGAMNELTQMVHMNERTQIVMSHINVSCHVWMSHVTYEWVMSHMIESCHIQMVYMNERTQIVMSHMNEPYHIWMIHVTYEWALWMSPHTWYRVPTISRLLKIIGLFCKRALLKRRYSAKKTYDFKEPTNRSHPVRMNQRTQMVMSIWTSHFTYQRVMTHMNESGHIWMSHVT